MQQPKSVPVSRTAPDFFAKRIEEFKTLFPEAIAEGGIDFDKLKMALGEEVDGRPERYSFAWAGKKDAIRLLQVPSRATLVPVKEESINFDTTHNIFIEGDNLEVLKLLWKSYFGRVKMIYIDPPYNTGNDFIYNDDYTDPLATYLVLTGQKNIEGNLLVSKPQTSGRFHSAWLSFLYPRLFLARQLLQNDGVIFVSIDDNEVHNLRLLMNEVFGEENFIAQISIQSNPRGRQAERFVAAVHEYLLLYSKDVNQCKLSGSSLTEEQMREFKYKDEDGRYYRLLGLRQRGVAWRREDRPQMYFPLYVNPLEGKVRVDKTTEHYIEVYPKKPTGEDGRWKWGKNKVKANLANLETKLISGRNEWDIFVRDYLDPGDGNRRTRKLKTIWADKALNYQNGTQEVKELLGEGIYEYPKPTALLREIITMSGNENAVCLDFFAGSCTTAQAVLQMNRNDGGSRQFIMVQLPELTPEDSRARKAGYDTIAQIGKERIRRVVAKMGKEAKGKMDLNNGETPEDLGFKIFKLAESNYRPWKGAEEKDPEAYAKQMELYLDPLVEGWNEKNVIYELALKEGYSLNSRIEKVVETTENKIWKVTDDEKEQSFFACLDDNLKEESFKSLALNTDSLFVCRDKALNDELAANLALQCNLKVI